MSYTVTEGYNRILEEADKIGSDYFTLPQVLNAFKKETLDFVGARAKEIELTQEVTDDIRTLVISKLIPFVPDVDNPTTDLNAALPNDYHTKLSLNVLYSDGLKARIPRIERHGEHNTNSVSPFKKPERMYPLIQQFSNYFNVITGLVTGGPITADKLIMIYLKKPTFGTAGTPSGIIVDLPDQVCEQLFAMTANTLYVNTGDERASSDFQINQLYRKK